MAEQSIAELEVEREKLLTRCLQVEENEAALIADRGALAEALTDMVRYYDGTDEMQEELQADFSGPDGLVPDAEVRRLVLANARNALARVMFEAARSDTGPQAQVRAETGVPAAPDGWQLVPKEPSWEILIDHGIDSETWAALLAASPTPPAAEAVGVVDDIIKEATFLLERISDLDWNSSLDEVWRDFYGHVEPSISRLRTALELQRERGAVAGQDGKSVSCALNAASTASDDLVKEIGQSMDVQYAIGSIINNEGPFFTGRGERMDRLVRAVLSSPPVREIVGALEAWRRWEADIILHADWSSGRAHLTQDQHDALTPIQEQRESILSRFQSVGGEKHDHADGTSAEAVEKVTQPK